jgi:hypothetical protein
MKVNLISEFGAMNSFLTEQLKKQLPLFCELNFVKTILEVSKSTLKQEHQHQHQHRHQHQHQHQHQRQRKQQQYQPVFISSVTH